MLKLSRPFAAIAVVCPLLGCVVQEQEKKPQATAEQKQDKEPQATARQQESARVRADEQAARAQAEQRKTEKPNVNPDALVLMDFRESIDKYMELHKKLEKDAPPLKETKDPAKITASQQAMAEKIRAARKDARPGEIFTPEIRDKFRRLMYPELKGPDGRETKAAIKDDAPAAVPLKVNAMYPEGAPLPTVPPHILATLPPLPEDLEYRIVDNHLILRDVHANIIVDFIPNAIR
jgi:hypothetical protein